MPLARVNSEVQAANLALGHLGERITALNEDREAARAVIDHFASVRVALLRRHNWNFATDWERLSADPTARAGRFSKVFPLPSNCLRVRSVDGLEEDDWEVETANAANSQTQLVNVLTCEIDAPRICYTRDILQIALWDSLFLDCFALMLASRLAGRIGHAESDGASLANRAENMIPTARRVNLREKARSRIDSNTSYVAVRR
jgi:hypothetical protein